MQLEIGPMETGRIGPEWTTLNCVAGLHVDLVATRGEHMLPFADCTFDLVYASHVLEHIWWYKTVDALKEAHRIIKPGGKLEIWVPDLAVIFKAYQTRKCGPWLRYNPDKDFMKYVNGRLFTHGPGEINTHRAAFDRAYLHRCLQAAGFKTWDLSRPRTPGHEDINLGVGGLRVK